MKIIYLFLVSVSLLCFGKEISAQCNISRRICFYDDSYFRYVFNSEKLIGLNIYYSEGTSTAYGGPAILTLDLRNGIANGKFKLSVINPYDNFCLLTDSFVCTGDVAIFKDANGEYTYTANGSFISYCDGAVANTGPWSITTICKNSKELYKPEGITPASGTLKINEYKKAVIVSPNPAANIAKITYSVKETGKVSVVIYNSMNQPVKTFAEQIQTPGNHTLQWDLLQSGGNKVINGIYRAVVTTPAGTSSANIQVTR